MHVVVSVFYIHVFIFFLRPSLYFAAQFDFEVLQLIIIIPKILFFPKKCFFFGKFQSIKINLTACLVVGKENSFQTDDELDFCTVVLAK